MTTLDVTLHYPDDRCIAINPPPGDPRTWAAATAQEFGAGTDKTAGTARLAEALTDLARMAAPERKILLITTADLSVLAPLTVTVTPEPLTPADQAEFLWSPDAVVPPTAEVVEADHLGPGISVAILHAQNERQYATRRWLFAGENGALGAWLGPVAPYGLTAVEGIAGQVILGSQVANFLPGTNQTLLNRFEAAAARQGERWEL
ncbi:MAG: hypothetical protein ACK5LN_14785 [Propioniciclava sp.]